MSKLLIYTCTSGHYNDYTPLWEYCISKSYPEYDYKAEKIEITNAKYHAACCRLFCHPSTTHDYIYVTDVDMMVLREDPSILDFHLKQMKKDKLNYSNSPRTTEYLGESRLTGLHFASQQWYKDTKLERESHLRLLKAAKIGERDIDDEISLMNICKNAKIGIPKPRPLLRRHHGIHMGTLRHYPNHSRQTRNQQLSMRISPKQAKQWLSFYDDIIFKEIIKSISKMNYEIRKELETLYSFCRR